MQVHGQTGWSDIASDDLHLSKRAIAQGEGLRRSIDICVNRRGYIRREGFIR